MLNKKRKIVRKVIGDLILACLSNVADRSDHVLIRSLNIPHIRVVYLESHILDWVL